jgi:putative ABC transport system substrate-binding protein
VRRRDFITLLGGAAAAWPLAARAQQADQLRRVGVLVGPANNALGQSWARAFREELARLGWTEGRTIAVDVRWGEGRIERYTEIAAEFVRLKVDVIVASSTPAAAAAMQATSTIPIVFTSTGDPVGTGLVASLARPGGNATGLSNQNVDIAGKGVALLRELFPGLRGLGILVNADNVVAMLNMHEVQAAARTFGLEVATLEIRRAEDIAPAFEALKGPALGLYVVPDPLMNSNAVRINTLALSAHLPTIYGFREYVETGGLISYGPDNSDQFRGAAHYVDKILRGAKPSDLPVEQPTRFYLVINLTTAKALGLTVPQTLLVSADELIE